MFEELYLPSGDFDNSGNRYVFDNCPECGREGKFSWDVSEAAGHCWVCDFAIGGEYNLKKYLEGSEVELIFVKKRIANKAVNIQERGQFHYQSAWDDNASRYFLRLRNVNETLCNKVPINFCDEAKCISIKVESIVGDDPIYLYRRPEPKTKWYSPKGESLALYGFNVDKFKNSNAGIILCEGIFDLLSSGLYNNGIAICGSSLVNSWVIWLSKNVSKVALVFDPDEAGEKANKNISEQLKMYGIPCKIFRLERPLKDYRIDREEDRKVIAELLDYIK